MRSLPKEEIDQFTHTPQQEPLGSNLEHTLEHLAHSGAPVTLGPSDQSLTEPLVPPHLSPFHL